MLVKDSPFDIYDPLEIGGLEFSDNYQFFTVIIILPGLVCLIIPYKSIAIGARVRLFNVKKHQIKTF